MNDSHAEVSLPPYSNHHEDYNSCHHSGDSAVMASSRFMGLPPEVLQHILLCSTTPSFLQLISTCRKLYELAAKREIVLYHLYQVPGIKLGLELNDHSVSTSELFLLLRQRASSHLYGVNFSADCQLYRCRNGSIDPTASFLATGTDYIDICLVLRESLKVRLYGGRCSCKEQLDSPYADGKGKVRCVQQRKHTISVLYSWTPESEDDVDVDEQGGLRGSTKNVVLGTVDESIGLLERSSHHRHRHNRWASSPTQYHLLHYHAYTSDPPVFFNIPPYKNLIPVDLAVSSRLQCAILWDEEGSHVCPTESATVILYSCERLPRHEMGTYTAREIPSAGNVEGEELKMFIGKARKIAFFKDGRRLKLYSPGSYVPFNVLSTSQSYSPSNQISLHDITWNVDTPFFAKHESLVDQRDGARVCLTVHLSLATTWLNHTQILCILKNTEKIDWDDCTHVVDLESMPHSSPIAAPAVVARLWGLQESHTNLAGPEMVATSIRGTRVAVSMWNKIAVWSLDPGILCEDWQEEQPTATMHEEEPIRGRRYAESYEYYEKVQDSKLSNKIVELKPIVLDLGDAVARKMAWRCRDSSADSSYGDTQSEADSHESGDSGQLDDSSSLEVMVQGLEVGNTTIPAPGNAEHRQVDQRQALERPEPTSQKYPEISIQSVFDDSATDFHSHLTVTHLTGASATGGVVDTAEQEVVSHGTKSKGKSKRKRRKGEDELVVLTDRGIQIWDLSVWGKGRRESKWLNGNIS